MEYYGKSKTGKGNQNRIAEEEFKERHCTDVICCALFAVCLLGFLICAAIGYVKGDPKKLFYPTDSAGDFCGVDKHKDKPYLFFFDLTDCAGLDPSLGCATPQICVNKCPVKALSYFSIVLEESRSPGEKSELRKDLYCKPEVDPFTQEKVEDLVRDEMCAPYTLNSVPFLRRCIPQLLADELRKLLTKRNQPPLVSTTLVPTTKTSGSNHSSVAKSTDRQEGNLDVTTEPSSGDQELVDILKELQGGTAFLADIMRLNSLMERSIAELSLAAPEILIVLSVATGLTFVWIVILRCFIVPLVFGAIFAFLGIFLFVSIFSYYQYYSLKGGNLSQIYGLPEAFISASNQHQYLLTAWLAFGCTSASLLLALIIVLFFLYSQIRTACALIAEACRVITKMPVLLLWPVVPVVMQAGLLAFYLFAVLHVATMGESMYVLQANERYNDSALDPFDVDDEMERKQEVERLLKRVPCDPIKEAGGTIQAACEFVKYAGTGYAQRMQMFMLFAFVWAMNFILALNQMTLAGGVAIYYWSVDKSGIFCLGLCTSLYRCIRFHLGSLAFGSLVVALVQLVDAVLTFVDRRLKRSNNPFAKFILSCLKTCVWCLEKFLKYINNTAYIMIAIEGRNLCKASKDGFQLIMRNIAQAATLDQVADFVMWLSIITVTGISGVASYYYFNSEIEEYQSGSLEYPVIPVVVVIVSTLFMASTFFSVYEVAVDTMYLCFLEDLERNNGSAEQPYFMSKNLMLLLKKGKGHVTVAGDTTREDLAARGVAAPTPTLEKPRWQEAGKQQAASQLSASRSHAVDPSSFEKERLQSPSPLTRSTPPPLTKSTPPPVTRSTPPPVAGQKPPPLTRQTPGRPPLTRFDSTVDQEDSTELSDEVDESGSELYIK